MSRSVIEQALLSGANMHVGAKHSDGTFPHNFWVSSNGNDGTGNGSFEAPYLTVRRFIRQAYDGRGDRGILTMGSYAETIDIGSGSTAGGNTNGGYAKRNLQIIGDDTAHNGLVQIVGDGTTDQPTIRVLTGYLRGFVLKNVELDVTTVTRPALHLTTDDALAAPSAVSNFYRFLVENVAIRSDGPNCGIVLDGATLGTLRKITMQGPTVGIGFCGNATNNPADLDLEDIDFRDCVTADLATVQSAAVPTTPDGVSMTNISHLRMRHWDRGGTPVTNYVNYVGTMVNVHGTSCFWARDVADDTLMVLPADVVFTGHSGAAVESIIGA